MYTKVLNAFRRTNLPGISATPDAAIDVETNLAVALILQK